jgi:glycosyltransferase involved in cell wall biosynthesis
VTEEAPDYSVIVPAYNEEAFLPHTLSRLREAMAALPFTGEVVVCDNNSTDGTRAAAEGQGARVVFEARNQISRARNTGARAARGRWLIFLDADTELSAPLLDAALRALSSGTVCGGGSTVEMGGDRVHRWFAARWNAFARSRGLAAGCFVFARREGFLAVGGFPETVYASEEIWFSRDLKRWGRERGLAFVVLADHPARTSTRKGDWYSPWSLLLAALPLLLFPPLVRSRTFCWLWYRRPAAAVPSLGTKPLA